MWSLRQHRQQNSCGELRFSDICNCLDSDRDPSVADAADGPDDVSVSSRVALILIIRVPA
jgi:hypothetical protein